MYQNYFIVNGKKYHTGTVFIVENLGKHVEASFVCYDTKRKQYVYKINDRRYHYHDDIFWKTFISITDKTNPHVHIPTVKMKSDLDIDGMFIGWVWYIFLMGLSVIFKDVIGLWIVISVIFFTWRRGKIKKEGTYIEW